MRDLNEILDALEIEGGVPDAAQCRELAGAALLDLTEEDLREWAEEFFADGAPGEELRPTLLLALAHLEEAS